MKNNPRKGFESSFLDMNRNRIREGDILIHRSKTERHERPYGRRVAVDGMGNEKIVNDTGEFRVEDAWVKYKVNWSKDCLVAERTEDSGNFDYGSTASHYLNSAFKSKNFEIFKVKQ